jgi:hypothetical protein
MRDALAVGAKQNVLQAILNPPPPQTDEPGDSECDVRSFPHYGLQFDSRNGNDLRIKNGLGEFTARRFV